MSNRDAQEFSGREEMNRDEESLQDMPDRRSIERNSVYKLAGGDRNDEGLSDLPDRQSIKDNSVYKLAQEAREKFGSGNTNDNPNSSGYSARHPDETNIGHKASKLEDYEDRMNNVMRDDNDRSSGAGGSAMRGNTGRDLNSGRDTSRASSGNIRSASGGMVNSGNYMSAGGSNMGDSQSGYQQDPNYSRQNNTNPHPVSQGGRQDDPARLNAQGAPTAYPDQRGYRHDPISSEDKENSLPETVTLNTEPIDVQSKLDGTSSEDWDATGDQNNQRGQQQRGNQPNQNTRQSNTPRYQSGQPSGDSQSGLRSDDLERGINAGPDVMPQGGRSGFESGSSRSSGGTSGQSGLRSDDLERGINAGPDVMPPGGTSGFDSPSRTPQSGKELFDSPNRNNETAGGVQAYDSHVQRRPDTTIRNDYEASNQRADMMDTTLRQDKDLTYMSGGSQEMNSGTRPSGNAPMAGGQTRQPGMIRPATKSAPSINDSHYETGQAGYVVDNRSNSLDGDDQGYNRIQGGTANEHHPGSRDRA